MIIEFVIACLSNNIYFYYFRSIMLFFGIILLLTTSYEIYSLRSNKTKNSVMHDLIISFSLINNTKKILSTKQNNSLGLECVNGIRALAMIFIIAGHACLFIGSGPVMDADAWDRVRCNHYYKYNTLI